MFGLRAIRRPRPQVLSSVRRRRPSRHVRDGRLGAFAPGPRPTGRGPRGRAQTGHRPLRGPFGLDHPRRETGSGRAPSRPRVVLQRTLSSAPSLRRHDRQVHRRRGHGCLRRPCRSRGRRRTIDTCRARHAEGDRPAERRPGAAARRETGASHRDQHRRGRGGTARRRGPIRVHGRR